MAQMATVEASDSKTEMTVIQCTEFTYHLSKTVNKNQILLHLASMNVSQYEKC